MTVTGTQWQLDAGSLLPPKVYLREVLNDDQYEKLTDHQARHIMIADLLSRQRALDAKGGE